MASGRLFPQQKQMQASVLEVLLGLQAISIEGVTDGLFKLRTQKKILGKFPTYFLIFANIFLKYLFLQLILLKISIFHSGYEYF